MAFDTDTQYMDHYGKSQVEYGRVAFTSGATVSVPTKMKIVKWGHGVTVTDGLTCTVTIGETSNGAVTFTRNGSVETDADTLSYEIRGW